MDNAVALVQSYLRLNGYFTVTEYPVLEAMKDGRYRMATDVDVVALRLPRAGGIVAASPRHSEEAAEEFVPDPILHVPENDADLIIAEVKEGRPTLNRGATNPDVLSAVLSRFGRCAIDDLGSSVQELRRHGRTKLSDRVQARLLAFGAGDATGGTRKYDVIPLHHVLRFLEDYLRENWDLLRHAQLRDPTFGFLATLKKARSDSQPEPPSAAVALKG